MLEVVAITLIAGWIRLYQDSASTCFCTSCLGLRQGCLDRVMKTGCAEGVGCSFGPVYHPRIAEGWCD